MAFNICSSALAVAFLSLAAAGCTTHHTDKPCPRNQPAFRLQVTAADGPLPADTRLVVTYGAGSETYTLAKGGPTNESVCCRPGDVVTNGRLPDVRCGLPAPAPTASTSASPPIRDASIHDGSMSPAQDATVPPLRDASMSTTRDGAMRVGADGASLARDATPPTSPSTDPVVRDASARDAASSMPSGTYALLCDLWTEGYAFIEVTGSGYPDFEHPDGFPPNIPNPPCGPVTLDLRIELGSNDAGVSPIVE